MKLLHLNAWVLALVILPILAFSQTDENHGVFAFAYNENGKIATSESIAEHKFARASEVFEKLVQAKGVKNMPRPTFIMDNSERRPAWTHPGKALVVLEEKAYDLCLTQGADSTNALAALIAHELIHYYEKHDWQNRFSQDHENVTSLNDSKASVQDLALELQADHLGGLLAHMAGYNTLGILPDLLPKIYNSYQLVNNKAEGYPTLEERRNVARNSDVILTKNSRIFDMSVYMTASGSHETAKRYLDFLLTSTQFQSREIYNNLGVLSTMMAMKYIPESEFRFQLPLELEMSSRLSTRATDESKKQALISEAEYNFKNAFILDDEFTPAMLNLAAVYILKDQLFDAEYYAKKAQAAYQSDGSKIGLSNASVMLGIISAINGETEKAKEYFIASNSEIGRLNLCALSKRSDCMARGQSKVKRQSEFVDDVQLDQLYSRIMQDKEQALLSINLDGGHSFHTIAKANSEILVALDENNIGDYGFYQIVRSSDVRYQEILRTGVRAKVIVDNFGQPGSIYSNGDYKLWTFENDHIIIMLDQDNIVKEWCLYKTTL